MSEHRTWGEGSYHSCTCGVGGDPVWRLLLISGSGLALVFAWVLWSNQISIWEQAAALLFATAGLVALWAAFTPDDDGEWLEDPTQDRRDPK